MDSINYKSTTTTANTVNVNVHVCINILSHNRKAQALQNRVCTLILEHLVRLANLLLVRQPYLPAVEQLLYPLQDRLGGLVPQVLWRYQSYQLVQEAKLPKLLMKPEGK